MWKRIAFGALVLAGGGTAAAGPAFTGFDAVAARGELVELRAPTWMDGKLRLGDGGTGHVTRRALGRSEAIGLFGDDVSLVDRYGRLEFTVAGPVVRGTLSGACVYGREERRFGGGALTVSEPTVPLRLRCTFTRDGAAIGTMTLAGVPGGGIAPASGRAGKVRVGEAALAIRSAHRLGARGVRTDMPVGYTLSDGGETVGAVDVNGFTRRRLALPRDAARRDAALAAGIALALFWDPGDTDD